MALLTVAPITLMKSRAIFLHPWFNSTSWYVGLVFLEKFDWHCSG